MKNEIKLVRDASASGKYLARNERRKEGMKMKNEIKIKGITKTVKNYLNGYDGSILYNKDNDTIEYIDRYQNYFLNTYEDGTTYYQNHDELVIIDIDDLSYQAYVSKRKLKYSELSEFIKKQVKEIMMDEEIRHVNEYELECDQLDELMKSDPSFLED